MIEAVRTGKPVSIEEFQELTENNPTFSYQLNEAKKAWKREQPKVYRGKRWNKTLNKAINTERDNFLFETEVEAEAETEGYVPEYIK